MILCSCAQVSEKDYEEFLNDPQAFFNDDDFMCRVDYMGRGCDACIERIEEIRKEFEQCIK